MLAVIWAEELEIAPSRHKKQHKWHQLSRISPASDDIGLYNTTDLIPYRYMINSECHAEDRSSTVALSGG